MTDRYFKNLNWDSFSRLLIMVFALLQVMRWRILPQFMDIYYHLSTAWGFLQAGGWSGWDFWQYAPVGRIHIYPPLFHLLLVFFLKLGVSPVTLAKGFETVTPVLFLCTLWFFGRRNFGQRFAFFTLLFAGAAMSFYMNLVNHIPATLAIIFGLYSLDQLLCAKTARSVFLLALAFYTHIGISWFFLIGIIVYGALDKERRGVSFKVAGYACAVSLPIIFTQLVALKAVSHLGVDLPETHMCRIKLIEYALALCGLAAIFKLHPKYRLFVGLFFAGFIFLSYPYRFFSAEGFLPIIFLAALGLEVIIEACGRSKKSYLKSGVAVCAALTFFSSPALIANRPAAAHKTTYKVSWFESAFTALLLPGLKTEGLSDSIWFPEEYLPACEFIQAHSRPDEILYSSINILGVAFSGIAGRATSNGLLPEIGPAASFDPIASSTIVVMAKDEDPGWVAAAENRYGLVKIGEGKLFSFYRNPHCQAKMKVRAALIPFWVIGMVVGIGLYVFMRPELRRRRSVAADMIVIGACLILSVRVFCFQLDEVRKYFWFSLNKSLHQRYEVVDGVFFKFMDFCSSKIPAGSDVLFYNPRPKEGVVYPGNVQYRFELEREKAKFYLYPIKVHIFRSGDEMDALPAYREEEVLKKVSFIIVSFPDRIFPGFKTAFVYDTYRYILVKDGQT
jgi:hypothetical protein